MNDFHRCEHCPSPVACSDAGRCGRPGGVPAWEQKVHTGPWQMADRTRVPEDKAAEDLKEFEANLKFEINRVKDAGLPQGYIVAVLHAYALQETQQMIKDA